MRRTPAGLRSDSGRLLSLGDRREPFSLLEATG